MFLHTFDELCRWIRSATFTREVGVYLRKCGVCEEQDNVLNCDRSVRSLCDADRARSLEGQGTRLMGRSIFILNLYFFSLVAGSDVVG